MPTTTTAITRQRAAQVLRECWGINPGPPIPEDVKAAFAAVDEARGARRVRSYTVLDWLQELTGDRYNWRAEPDWNHRAAHFSTVR